MFRMEHPAEFCEIVGWSVGLEDLWRYVSSKTQREFQLCWQESARKAPCRWLYPRDGVAGYVRLYGQLLREHGFQKPCAVWQRERYDRIPAADHFAGDEVYVRIIHSPCVFFKKGQYDWRIIPQQWPCCTSKKTWRQSSKPSSTIGTRSGKSFCIAISTHQMRG